MGLQKAERALSRKAPGPILALAALLLLAGMDAVRARLSAAAEAQRQQLAALAGPAQSLRDAEDEERDLGELKAKDLESFKAALSGLTQSRRAFYEAGLQLQEEKRELEKLWEILTTYLLVDEAAKKVSVMSGGQALVTYPIGYAPPRVFGGGSFRVPALARIVSKERFAHPERGQAREVDGKLQWEPPQEGTSARANSLGEYVVFTDGPVILHGPPKRAEEHEKFPHVCLGLPLAVARRLYERTFIGTKILFEPAPAPP